MSRSRIPGRSPTAARRSPRTVISAGYRSLDDLGLEKATTERFSANTDASSDDKSTLINGIYRNIFGNAYLYDADVQALSVPESALRKGTISVKEFVRAVAKSDSYVKRFFSPRPLYGAIELATKHLLGRTPDGLEDYRRRSAVYDAAGYGAMIDSMMDDGEYDGAFGDDTAPFLRGHLSDSGLSMAAFTHLFAMQRGACASDKSIARTGEHGIGLNSAGIRSTPLPVEAPEAGEGGGDDATMGVLLLLAVLVAAGAFLSMGGAH